MDKNEFERLRDRAATGHYPPLLGHHLTKEQAKELITAVKVYEGKIISTTKDFIENSIMCRLFSSDDYNEVKKWHENT